MVRASWVRMGLLALLWGSCFLWIKLALTGLSPVAITVIRSALGAGTLLALALVSRQRLPRDRRTWGHLVVAALFCNAVPFVLFGIGQQTVDSGVAGVLNATTPLWSVLIGLMVGTDRGLGVRRYGGLLVGFTGVLLIFAPWQHSGLAQWGTVAILAAAVSYAVAFAYMARTLGGRGVGTMSVSAAQLLAATGWSVLALPVMPGPRVEINVVAVVAVVILGIFGTGLTSALNFRLIADEGATSAATVGYLLPVVSVLLGALVLDEALTVRVIVGMVVVLVGVGLSRPRALPAGSPAVALPAAAPVR